MHRSKDVFTHNTLVEHDSVLVIVAFPRHISHKKVASESKFTVLCSISFCQDIAFLDPLSLVADWTKVDCHILVGTAELRYSVFLERRLKAYKLFFLRTVIKYSYGCSVNVLNNTIALGSNHCTRINTDLTLYTSSYDRSLIVKQRNGLAHHIAAHQCAVRVVMLQERNQAGGD